MELLGLDYRVLIETTRSESVRSVRYYLSIFKLSISTSRRRMQILVSTGRAQQLLTAGFELR